MHPYPFILKPVTVLTPMSLADALGPHLTENVPFDDAYLARDAEQSALIDQDEEMEDLFDENAVVDHVERCSISPSAPYYTIFIELVWELSHRNTSVSDGGQADAISDAEQRHREAMEYAEEEEEPDQDGDHPLLEQRTEASALLPNVPSPRSSDGQVCTSPNYLLRFPLTSLRVGSLGCPTLSK